jgi:hypothetical protein
MRTQIGKYILKEDEYKFSISYRYTFSDLLGGFWFLLMLLLGLFMLLTYYKTFTKESLYNFTSWAIGLIGLFLSLFGTYLLAAGLYNPRGGIFRADKLKQEVTLADILKSETIPFINISSVFHNIESSRKPRTKYSMLCLRLTNGELKKCFVVRSGIPIDVGRKVDKDLNIVSRQLRDAISKAINLG